MRDNNQKKHYELSHNQRSQWFLFHMAPKSGAYNVNYTWKITPPFCTEKFRTALTHLHHRHPAFLTTFPSINGKPVQRIIKGLTPALTEINGSDWSNDDIWRFIKEEESRPINLDSESSYRYTIVTRKEGFILSITTHHISTDLWSYMMFINDLRYLYHCENQNTGPNPFLHNVTYNEFVDWQNRWVKGAASNKSLNFWFEKLEGDLPILNLPFDSPKDPKMSFLSDYSNFLIQGDKLKSLIKFSKHEGVSLYILFMAIYLIFLYRYTGDEDLLLGTPSAGRDKEKFDSIIGYFVNLFTVRIKVSKTLTFRGLLKQVKEEILSVREHQDFPFSLLVEKLKPKREANQSPIIQTIYSWEDSNRFVNRENPIVSCNEKGNEIWDMQDFSMELVNKIIINEFDLSLRIASFRGCLRVYFDYNPDVFRKASIERMISSFKEMIWSIMQNPESSLEEISILPQREKDKIVNSWNCTSIQENHNEDFASLFEEVVLKYPENVAVHHKGKQTSYEELNNRSNQIAHYLQTLGINPGMIIGISLDRSLEMIASILGILKCGGAYLPLDPGYPAERLDYMVADSKPPIIISDSNYADIFSKGISKVVKLDSIEDEINALDKNNLSLKITPQNLAYVIYTSGSTGLPKGVLLEHNGLCNVVQSQEKLLGLTPADRVLQFASFNFDASLFEIVMAIGNGASLYLEDKKRILPGPDLVKYLIEMKVSNLTITPSALASLPEVTLPDLKTVVVAGEVCSNSLAQKWYQKCDFFNAYGPTEATIWSTIHHVKNADGPISIGKPIPNTQIYILDETLNSVPIGVRGEIYIGGVGIAREYLNRPDLTAERFIANPFDNSPSSKLYRTGDQARYRENGHIEYLGRADFQVKIRGHRIETGEIESAINQHPKVNGSIIKVFNDKLGNKQLVAYLTPDKDNLPNQSEILAFLRRKLPNFMLPSMIVPIKRFPWTINGKIDLKSLPDPFQKSLSSSQDEQPESLPQIETDLIAIWQEILNHMQFGVEDNFFDSGGNSLLMLQVFNRLPESIRENLEFTDLFEYPTIRSLWQFLHQKQAEGKCPSDPVKEKTKCIGGKKIAIIGMSGRFPGADSIDELWQNLVNGVETISHFTDEELLAAGLNRDIIDMPNYVKSKGVLKNSDLFDSRFFGFSPKQADITDPQHRIFLECSWEALENAGYDPARYQGQIGIFGGTGYNTYRDGLMDAQSGLYSTGDFPVMIGNEKDFLCTRVAYKLNLKGPAVVNQSACSTSLVAVHAACRALENLDCDMALAGGVSIIGSNYEGYIFQKGGILSPDGHCRPFDARSQGTVPGQGVGLVVLKRLEDALEDGDTIHAVIAGSAVNNDGSLKAGYTAPGVDGQVKVIQSALDKAGVNPSSISYVETHGTGTPLGDPIEIRALSKVYGNKTNKKQLCALGAAKSNLGHLDAAAGVTGLIKAVLSIKHRQLSPIANFETPNPAINFEESPFYITDRLMDWDAGENPLRAGVSSFGIGGTNAHVIVEEPPNREVEITPETWQILPLSAKTPAALKKSCDNLLHFLENAPSRENQQLSDIAYTLQTGRQEFQHRCVLTCQSREEVIRTIKTRETGKITFSSTTASSRPVAFMFPGQGSQYVNMARELYLKEPIFKMEIDACFDFLLRQQDLNIKPVLFPDEDGLKVAKTDINETIYTQPILFSIEYALAKLWIAYGVHPQSMIGHSIGEYTAACISGVFSLKDALMLVCERSRLIQALPHGDMLSIRVSEEELRPLMDDNLSLAAVNTPHRCVVSGESEAIGILKNRLEELNKDCSILHTSHAFHSRMLDPILERFRTYISGLTFNAPQIPYISNVTGDWIRKEQAVNPDYWVSHLRGTVRFSKGVKQLMKNPDIVFLEVGPGRVLRTLSAQNLEKAKTHVVVSSVSPPSSRHSDLEYILSSLGRLWLHGVKVDWEKLWERGRQCRIPLPTYPFERRRHWLEARERPRTSSEKIPNIGDWFYLPTWKQAYHKDRFSEKLELTYAMKWLIFIDQHGLGLEMADMLRSHDQRVVEVGIGAEYKQVDGEKFEINPKRRSDVEKLVETLENQEFVPQKIIHMWNVIGAEYWGLDYFNYLQSIGLGNIIYLLQVFDQKKYNNLMQFQIVTDNAQEIQGNEQLSPGKSTQVALVNGIQQEYPHIYCQTVDVAITGAEAAEKTDLITRLIKEINTYGEDQFIAYRKEYRWIQAFEKRYLEPLSQNAIQLKNGGVYIITGGLGKIGLIVAEYLAKKVQAKIALIGRSSFPDHGEWQQWVEDSESSNEISAKIEKLTRLERIGAELLVLQADISDFEQSKKAVDIIEKTFGEVNGIFHAAGEIGQNTLHRINKITPEILEQQFKPKVHGAFVLEQLFKDRPLSFVMMFSSLSTILGGVEYTAYAAANAFLDGFTRLLDRYSPIRWITINWDGWKTDESLDLNFLITPEEGEEVLNRILSQNFITQLIISTIDLFNRQNQVRSKPVLPNSEREPNAHTRPALTASDQEESYIAPRNDIEYQIVKIWEEFLGIERISINDDFFEIGGDSLMAVRLTARLEESFPGAVTEKTILQESTVSDLALAIQNNLESQSVDSQDQQLANYQSLLQIQKGNDSKRSLFLVHTGLGFVYYYIDLAKSLGRDRPVYAFQARGIQKESVPLTSISEMASAYIEELLDFKPFGPYQLGGASAGGFIAFEMAKQLKEKGHQVSLLSMIDTPGPVTELPRPIQDNVEIISRMFGDKLNLNDADSELHDMSLDSLIKFVVHRGNENSDSNDLSYNFVESCIRVARVLEKAMFNYHPEPYSGSILFFKHSEPLEEFSRFPELPWIDLAEQGVHVIKAPGNHYSMNMSPNVSFIANQIKTRMV